MRNLLIITSLLIFGLNGFGQDVFGDKEDVKNRFPRKLEDYLLYTGVDESNNKTQYSLILEKDTIIKSYNIDDTDIYRFKDEGELFKVTRIGLDSMEAIYHFNNDSLFMDWSHIWKSCRIKYYNTDYVAKNFELILSNKTNKWIKVKDGYYITKKRFSFLATSSSEPTFYLTGQMKIVQPQDENVKLELLITPLIIERKEWKSMIKGK